ncbi:MAG TPA: sigma-54-dependent Fis family transcriptional regulator [Desulfocapsa sulfexigens]|nr:sigma-54-dependent Fis family transcriptional regulator [Desulfocapsa sulfexigens]
MVRILLAEDDEIMRISVYDRLKQFGWQVDEVENGLDGVKMLEKKDYHLVISDIRMPGMDGLKLLEKVKEHSPETDIIIMTAYGSVNNALDCMRQGASDYVLKPFDLDDLIIRCNRLLDMQSVKARCATLEENCQINDRGLIGNTPPMQQVYSVIDQAAPTNATILITGESGTGKELAARAIHRASLRKDKPFVSINCAAIPEGLMESEMFGHERGAFTGADKKRKGKFELADNGTLLLDELGDLPGPLQAKLLRVLQEGEFERVGGSKTISVDVRVLACTAKDLQKEVDEGRFRQDLLFRLKVIPITMPPLREHKEDIYDLCLHFLKEFDTRHSKPFSLSQEALECLQSYSFPGNARELRNLMERASVLSSGPVIYPDDLPTELCSLNGATDVGFNLADNVAVAEQACLKKALNHCDGNRTKSADLLGISRKNLWEKMKIYGIE